MIRVSRNVFLFFSDLLLVGLAPWRKPLLGDPRFR